MPLKVTGTMASSVMKDFSSQNGPVFISFHDFFFWWVGDGEIVYRAYYSIEAVDMGRLLLMVVGLLQPKLVLQPTEFSLPLCFSVCPPVVSQQVQSGLLVEYCKPGLQKRKKKRVELGTNWGSRAEEEEEEE